MKELEKQVYSYFTSNNLITAKDNLVLAISGGADSIFMLSVLNNINKDYGLELNMVVCHLNHMLRNESVDDLEYVRQYSKQLDIPFFSEDINIRLVSQQNKQSEEEAGREERYKFFNRVGTSEFGEDNYKICSAHNLSDNTETVFLNLLRGTGIDGLKGIENLNNNIIRPILFVDRESIEKYLNDSNIKYVVDSTNFEVDYTRNSVRNELLPFIKEKYNPNIDETIFRMSEILKAEDLLLEDITKHMFEDIVINLEEQKEKLSEKREVKLELDLNKFNDINIALRRRILRYVLKKYFNVYKNISKINIDDVIKLAYNNIGNKHIMLNKDIKVAILKGVITITN